MFRPFSVVHDVVHPEAYSLAPWYSSSIRLAGTRDGCVGLKLSSASLCATLVRAFLLKTVGAGPLRLRPGLTWSRTSFGKVRELRGGGGEVT